MNSEITLTNSLTTTGEGGVFYIVKITSLIIEGIGASNYEVFSVP